MNDRAFVISFLAVVMLVLAYLGTSSVYHASQQRLTRQYLATIDPAAKGVIIGDSHIGDAFRVHPREFVNLAAGGTTVWMWASTLRSYRSRQSIDELVIILSPHIFADYRLDNDSTLYLDLPQGSALQTKTVYNSVVKEIAHRSLRATSRQVTHLALREEKKPASVATPWLLQSEAERIRSTRTRAAEHQPSPGAFTSSMALAYRALLADMAASGTKVCMVTTPVSAMYSSMILPDALRPGWEAFVDDLQRIEGVRYVHFASLAPDWPMELFANQDHLNRSGSDRFSPMALQACFGQSNKGPLALPGTALE